MSNEIAASVAFNYIIEFINHVRKQFNHHLNFNENVNRLKRTREEMNCRIEDVEAKMNSEHRPGKKFKREVKLWLENGRRLSNEEESIESKLIGISFYERFRLAPAVVQKSQEIEEHYQKGSFTDGLVIDEPPGKGLIWPTAKLAGETATRKKEEILSWLIADDNIRKIGVYGLAGSGKTIIMNHISNHIIEETENFHSVIMVSVSKASNVKKLQEDLASVLNIDISRHKDEEKRAAELYANLVDRKRYLLILDGMEKAFPLEVVGIPEPTLDNGCKMVLIARSLDVCRRMDCKDTKMELLSEGEARNFFFDTVGRDVLHTAGLEEIVEHVADECGCLPLAIAKIATSMKGVDDEHEWRNVLEELRDPERGLKEMQKVLQKLQCSYSCLEDDMLKSCFLHCALYLEDEVLERRQLIDRLIVDGIVEGKSAEAKVDKGHSMLNKLENACLLENVTNGCVKMRNLIVSMAFQIICHHK